MKGEVIRQGLERPYGPDRIMTTVTILNIAKEETAAIEELSARTAVTKVLVADIGGNHIKLLVTGQSQPRKVVSGPLLDARADDGGNQGGRFGLGPRRCLDWLSGPCSRRPPAAGSA